MAQKKEDVTELLLKKLEALEQQNAALAAKVDEMSKQPQRGSRAGQPRPNVWYELLQIPQAGATQPQGIAVAQILNMAANPKHIPEVEAMELVEKHRDMLLTRQKPWRIFQYYRPQLITLNCLRMHQK